MSVENHPLNLAEARARAEERGGAAIWRSLEELCPDPSLDGAEEPDQLAELQRIWDGGISRRQMLKFLGASMALAGVGSLGGCSDKPPDPRIVPYVNQPEAIVPGQPLYFATAMPMQGFARGVLVATREGRPIKVEGNPDHPASLGGTDVFMQASILTLYDPDRSKTVTFAGEPRTWGAFWDALESRLAGKRASGGKGLRIVSGPITSPTLIAQKAELLKQFPAAGWHQFDPIGSNNSGTGTKTAFGRALAVQHNLQNANVILALDSDFLFADPASPRYARDSIDARRVRRDRKEMNRLYSIESTLTITGSMADHRLAVRPSVILELTRHLAARCGVTGQTAPVGEHAAWIATAAEDLMQHRGASLVIAGESQPPEVHVLVHQINHALGNIGQTVLFTELIVAGDTDASLASLAADIRTGQVDTLLILGENPAYMCSGDSGFAESLAALSTQRRPDGSLANFTAHLGLHNDETAFRCQWHLPESHYLEMWGDLRAYDGTASIVQPTIQPLYPTHSINEVLERILGRTDRSGYEIIRSAWQQKTGLAGNDFDQWWRETLRSGVVKESAAASIDPGTPRSNSPSSIASHPTTSPTTAASESLELVFRPDGTVWDGRFSNNAWMQELPKPFIKLVWSNAALIAPRTAERLQLADEDVVNLTMNRRSIEAPVIILPGLPDNAVTLHLGYGRSRAGRVGDGRGFDAYPLRSERSLWFATGARLSRTGRQVHLVTTRSHHAMSNLKDFRSDIAKPELKPNAVVSAATPEEERDLSNRRLVRVISLEQFKANEQVVQDLGGEKEKRPLLSLYPGPQRSGWDYSKGYQWGMSIDMTACIGCNACVIACQAENNIPVVGPEEVDRQREMHWIRIDDYFAGSLDSPAIYHQPVPCMHCENAPCEYVCPTGATTHSAEGLNQMTYNRCVGTRYCSNNCPYKVRRFNFLGYSDWEKSEQRMLQRNPDVTVRTNGVMEKCTYCIQRIQRTRIEAEKMLVGLSEQERQAGNETERQNIRQEAARREAQIVNGLETACQQACPTRAIIFGSINQVAGQKTQVATLKEEPLDYSLLRELTTKPRTTYLARVINPNPSMASLDGRTI